MPRPSGALDATGLPPDLPGVEPTERQLVRTAPSVRADPAAIRALGVRLAIDDFGTGRTGIDHLRELPVSTITIDRTFTMGLGEDRTNTALTDAIITLSHGLGMTVTAEGVETPDHLALLRARGCDRAQGFLIGGPQTPEAVSALVRERGGEPFPCPGDRAGAESLRRSPRAPRGHVSRRGSSRG